MVTKSRRASAAVRFVVGVLSLFGTMAFAQSPRTSRSLRGARPLREISSRVFPSAIVQKYDQLPLSFEPNLGQAPAEARFLSRGPGFNLFLTRQGAELALEQLESYSGVPSVRLFHGDPLRRRERRSAVASVLSLTFSGANQASEDMGMDQLPGRSTYLIGTDPQKWHSGVPTYARVKYKELYPGVDLVFYGNPQHLEYDFVVAPKVDPGQIVLSLSGASRVRLDSQGNLRIAVAHGEVDFRKPVIYQQEEHGRRKIAGSYFLASNDTIRFQVGSYDRNRTLIIDPVLDYSTYLGGSSDEFGFGMAVDSSGDAFVVGETTSTDFPTTAGAVQTANNSSSGTIFVTEINPTGTAILYSTYIGGSGTDTPARIALDSASPANVYITGNTCSPDFPTTSNALMPTFVGAPCAGTGGGTGFVTKFNPALSGTGALLYSTYLGGNGGNSSCVYVGDAGTDLAVDAAGDIYVTGSTCSTNFPTTTGGFQTVNHGGGNFQNVFVSRIDPTKTGNSSLVYSTYVGGSGPGFGDVAYGIAVDSAGNAYITGVTDSPDFPTTSSAYQQAYPPGGPAFITRVDTTATGSASLVYSSFLGGSTNGTAGFDIGLGPNNVAYVTGFTLASDFPVTAGAYLTNASNVTFLGLIDTSKSGESSLAYSTYLGPSSGDSGEGNGIAVDSQGNAYIAGDTYSTAFPITPGAFQTSFSGCAGGFISELRPLGNGSSDLAYSTFFGGTEPSSICPSNGIGSFGAWDVALDSSDNAYVTGGTGATDFPISPANAYQTSLKGSSDAYVAKLSLPASAPTPVISELSVSSGVAGTSVTISGTKFNMNQGDGTVTFGEATASVDSWSSTSIIALVPGDAAPGAVQVAVHTASGTSNTENFTVIPSIAALSPASGPAGTTVTISGYNFGSSGSVTFGGVTAMIGSWSPSSIILTVPTGATTGDVIVASNGTSSADGTLFTVVQGLGISSLSADSGTAGMQVTITLIGNYLKSQDRLSVANFGSSQETEGIVVTIGGVRAAINSWTADTVVAIVPNTANPGLGAITVTLGSGQTARYPFTVIPRVRFLSPFAGHAGQTIVIHGADFGSSEDQGRVQFGAAKAQVRDWTSTAIAVRVPALPNGAVGVTVEAGSVRTNSQIFTVKSPRH
jgi:IPT/TIG domain/Beta-propeller repeat